MYLKKYLKFLICVVLIFSFILPAFASVENSVDSNAFVSKDEFDEVLSNFRNRLSTFKAGVNSKIDSQVTTYLDRNGIWNASNQTNFEGKSILIDSIAYFYPSVTAGDNKEKVVASLNGMITKKGLCNVVTMCKINGVSTNACWCPWVLYENGGSFGNDASLTCPIEFVQDGQILASDFWLLTDASRGLRIKISLPSSMNNSYFFFVEKGKQLDIKLIQRVVSPSQNADVNTVYHPFYDGITLEFNIQKCNVY